MARRKENGLKMTKKQDFSLFLAVLTAESTIISGPMNAKIALQRLLPGVRLSLGLTVDYDILSWVDDVILGGLVSYSRWLRH